MPGNWPAKPDPGLGVCNPPPKLGVCSELLDVCPPPTLILLDRMGARLGVRGGPLYWLPAELVDEVCLIGGGPNAGEPGIGPAGLGEEGNGPKLPAEPGAGEWR